MDPAITPNVKMGLEEVGTCPRLCGEPSVSTTVTALR